MKMAKILCATMLAVFFMNDQVALGRQHWDLNGTHIYNTNSGNVGIGTTTPQALLHLQAESGNTVFRLEESTGGVSRIMQLANDGDLRLSRSGTGGADISIQPDGDIILTDLTPQGRTGNVGIGTHDPEVALAVNADGAVIGGDFFFDYSKGGPENTLLQVRGDEGSALDIVSEYNYDGDTYHISFILSPVFGTSGLYTQQPIGANRLPFTFNLGDLGEVMRLDTNGNVGIGTTTPTHLLTVNGNMTAEEVEVVPAVAPDFVFEDDYALPSLAEVERYIDEHGHLPEIPSAAEMHAEGVGLSAMQMKLLQKIEELTLYLIEQQKQITDLEKSNALLREHLSSAQR